MPQFAKIPATVVTGFLGAGKTTLIRRLLETADRRIALIINEFGDIGMDREILTGCGDTACADAGDIVELANGCICCTVADEFLPVMQSLLARDPKPAHIVIETSGLALPKPLVDAFNWPEIKSRVTVDGVITVVDGPATASGRFAADPAKVDILRRADPALDHESPLHEVFADQIACADLVVVAKTDLLDETGHDAVRTAIDPDLKSGAQVLNAVRGDLPAAVLLGMNAAAEDDLATRKSHHDGDGDHDHDDFETIALSLREIDSPDRFAAELKSLIEDCAILRAKGHLAVTGRPMRLVVQAAGPRIDWYFDRPFRTGEDRAGRLVLIGLKGMADRLKGIHLPAVAAQ